MLKLRTTSRYKKDRKLMKKQGKDLSLLDTVINKLLKKETLDVKYRDHPLKGNYSRFRECHVEPDWLFIYAIDKGQLILTASRTGSHSELF
ncbi:MAG: type II toxin-antitoxin system YafQ family toxin [Fibromonadaceae bacterium]|jgi:mRNA interferase YafQ|nr:type II toxin-antitoxin system YafQ family toxin [Fibromonadaceae bacterium]